MRCTVSLDSGCLTNRGILEERMHPGVSAEDRRIETAEGAMLENTWEKQNLHRPACDVTAADIVL